MSYQAVVLINRADGHNKFWRATMSSLGDKFIVTRNWGRIGQVGSDKSEIFSTEYSALLNIRKLIEEKERDSYTKISDKEFERQTAIASAIGTANKILEVKWLEFIDSSPAHSYIELRNYTSLPTVKDADINYVYTTEERLSSPDCNPGLMLDIETKKKYQESNRHCLIIAEDKIYSSIALRGYSADHIWKYKADVSLIKEDHPLYALAQKVQKAIYHILNQ